MARLTGLTVNIAFPDVSPADVETLREAADALPEFGHDALRAELLAFADRVARMLVTARAAADPETPT